MVEKQKLPRGLRNNNPGNIVRSSVRWVGEIDGTDTRFCTFRRMVDGYITIIKVLRAYEQKHNLHTVRQIFHRYCPYSKDGDNPDSYAKYVCTRINLALTEIDQPLIHIDIPLEPLFGKKAPDARQTFIVWMMLQAITEQENGIALTHEYRNEDGFPLKWDAYIAIWEFLTLKFDYETAENSLRYVEKTLQLEGFAR